MNGYEEDVPTIIRTETHYILKVPIPFTTTASDWKAVLIKEFTMLLNKTDRFIEGK